MSTLASPVKSITELRIYQLPAGKVVSVGKAIRYDGKTFILGTDGVVYSSCVKDRAFYSLAAWGWATSMVRALTRLGVISRKDATLHVAAAKQKDRERNLHSRVTSLIYDARKLGVRLTAKQQRTLRKLKP